MLAPCLLVSSGLVVRGLSNLAAAGSYPGNRAAGRPMFLLDHWSIPLASSPEQGPGHPCRCCHTT
jgi:hypothetical protein